MKNFLITYGVTAVIINAGFLLFIRDILKYGGIFHYGLLITGIIAVVVGLRLPKKSW